MVVREGLDDHTGDPVEVVAMEVRSSVRSSISSGSSKRSTVPLGRGGSVVGGRCSDPSRGSASARRFCCRLTQSRISSIWSMLLVTIRISRRSVGVLTNAASAASSEVSVCALKIPVDSSTVASVSTGTGPAIPPYSSLVRW